MKLFITGATGFIGSHVVKQALAQGHEVIALRRPGSRPRIELPREPRWVDAALDENLAGSLAGCDALLHLASHTPNPPYAPLADCLYWNVYASVKLATQAVEAGVNRFLIAGSCFEYGSAADALETIGTDTPLAPSLSYPVSKASASVAFQGYARAQALRLKILRIFQAYGEGEQASRMWPSMRAAALAGNDFPMSAGEQVRDFVEVGDVAAQFLRHLDFSASTPGVPTVHHVASGKPQTLLAFAQGWWTHWEAQGRLLPGAVPYRQGEIMRLVPATEP